MKGTLGPSLFAAFVGFGLLAAGCSARFQTHGATNTDKPKMGLTRLQNLLAPVEEWSDTNYSTRSWSYLLEAAHAIQNSDPRSVETALHAYQMLFSTGGDFQMTRGSWFEADGKLFILLKVAFDLPEHSSGHVFLGCWIRDPATFPNMAWPLQWNDGHPALVSGLVGLEGYRWDAAHEYRYLKEHFGWRDLSASPLMPLR